MAIIRVTKHYDFEMAHALYNYDGLCKNLHGHTYHLYVTVKGEPINDVADKKNGMVIDFSDLKVIVKKNIVDVLDHSVALYKKSPIDDFKRLGELYERNHVFDFQPTCENLVIYIADKIMPMLPEGVSLYNVKLYETANSYAEWNADDN